MLYKQFVVWCCNGCSITPLKDYANNRIYQNPPTESDYFSSADERLFLDMRDSMGYTLELEKLRHDDGYLIL